MSAPEQPDLLGRLLDWGWAILAGALGVIWKMLHGRINRAEDAVDKMSARMDELHETLIQRFNDFERESKNDRHQFRDAMQSALDRQATTQLEVARRIGELAGEVSANRGR
jgi:hypothetical protein